MSLIINIPSEVSRYRVLAFLNLKALVLLDTAFANKRDRKSYNEIIDGLAFLGNMNNILSKPSCEWLTRHRMGLGKLSLGREVYDSSFVSMAQHMTVLREISLKNCVFLSDSAVIALSLYCPKLKYLNLQGCEQLTNTSVVSMAQRCHSLTTVDLSNCKQLTDAAIIALAENCPNLTVLSVSHVSSVTDASISCLAKHCVKLQNINLRHCAKLTDTSVVPLVRACTDIRTVDLSFLVNITDQCIIALGRHCALLKSVYVNKCNRITDTGETILRSLEHSAMLWLSSRSHSACPKIETHHIILLCSYHHTQGLYCCLRRVPTYGSSTFGSADS